MAYILELFVVLSIEDSSSGPCLFGKPSRKTDSPETVPEGLCGFRYKLHPFKIFSHLVKSVGLTPMGFPSVGFPSGKPPRKTHLVKSVGLTPLRFVETVEADRSFQIARSNKVCLVRRVW